MATGEWSIAITPPSGNNPLTLSDIANYFEALAVVKAATTGGATVSIKAPAHATAQQRQALQQLGVTVE